MTSARWIAVTAGLLTGVLLGVVLPSSWVFVEEPPAEHAEQEQADQQYACPMFCVVLDEPTPDGRCPVCGMQLAVISGEAKLNAQERQMAGLEVGTLERLPLVRTVRTVGEVDYDETALARITTRAQGWLQEVHVDAMWSEVEKGQPLVLLQPVPPA